MNSDGTDRSEGSDGSAACEQADGDTHSQPAGLSDTSKEEKADVSGEEGCIPSVVHNLVCLDALNISNISI